jgi:hypothetical protein
VERAQRCTSPPAIRRISDYRSHIATSAARFTLFQRPPPQEI